MIHLDAWCTAPATQDRRFSPLLSSRRGRDTAAYFHRYAIPVNPLPDFRPNVVRNETGQSLFVFQALYPRTRARCVTSLSIISYVYTCTYEDDDDGRIHTRRESKLAFVSRFFFFFCRLLRSRSRLGGGVPIVRVMETIARECEAPRFRFARKFSKGREDIRIL